MPEGDTPPVSGEALSPAEVQTLVENATPPASPAPIQSATPAAISSTAGVELEHSPFDFRQSRFLAPIAIKKLRARHEEFALGLAARLSLYLRMEVTATLVDLLTLPYSDLTKSFLAPTHLSLFKADPLPGVGLLEIPVKLGLTMVDRLLGGPAQGISSEHGLSEIELALLAQVVQVILTEWCQLWSITETLTPKILGYEPSGQFIQSSPRDALMLLLVMQVKLGEAEEKIQLAVPGHSLESALDQLGQLAATFNSESRTNLPSALRWNKSFDEIRIPVAAFWDHLELKARELANLKPGDVLPMDRQALEQVRLRLGNLPKFEGRLGTISGKWAIALTGLVKLEP